MQIGTSIMLALMFVSLASSISIAVADDQNASTPFGKLKNFFNRGESDSQQKPIDAADLQCDILVAEFKLQNNAVSVIGASAKGTWNSIFNGKSRDQAVLEAAKSSAQKSNWMPLSLERRYGEYLHNERLKQGAVVLPSTKNRRYRRLYKQSQKLLKELAAALPSSNPFEFRVFITSSLDIDAEALPGGYIYVSRGALRSESAAAVVAHEIAHVTKRHTTRELQVRLVESVTTLSELQRLLAQKGAKPNGALQGLRALHGKFLRYSRQQELEADACAVRIVAEAPNVDGKRAVEATIRELRTTEQQRPKNAASDHPSYPERERVLRAALHRRGY